MTQRSQSDADDGDHEWRFSVDDVGPEAEPEVPEPEPIEAEPISLEHAVFVGLGVLLALGIMATAL